ncbi:MAG: TlyA family RNA methyltransferase [Ilumatobacteraceae bacterium]
MAGRRQRLDLELVRREVCPSRAAAAEDIAAGRILVNGAAATKASHQVLPGDALRRVGDAPRFVSRGGDKLDAALDAFGIDVTGLRVLDAGASTGGFTDCLLQRQARQVVAVDVGHGQLHSRLRNDPRVHVFERLHVRDLTTEQIGGPVDMVVADLSFISLRSVLGALLAVAVAGAPIVLLVKPQFEAGRRVVSRGRGIVTDPAVHAEVVDRIIATLGELGAEVRGQMESPLRGAEGNTEFLVYAVVGRSGLPQ